jgi:hypothetical protein
MWRLTEKQVCMCRDWNYPYGATRSRILSRYQISEPRGLDQKFWNKIQSTALPPASDPIRYWVLTPINEATEKLFVNRWHHFSYSANSQWRILSILAGWHSMVYCTEVLWSWDSRASQHQHTVRCNFSANSPTPTNLLFQPTQMRHFKVWN